MELLNTLSPEMEIERKTLPNKKQKERKKQTERYNLIER
jgi:hypothetical protein